jgi:hypothetical protein
VTTIGQPALRAGLVYVFVWLWEYQCCADTPAVHQQVDWRLHARDPDDDDHDAWTIVDARWDRERERVCFAGGCADWPPEWGSPPDRVCLTAEWHAARDGVATAGVIEELYEVTRLCREESRAWEWVPDTRRYVAVPQATMWPADGAADSNGERRETIGVVAGVRLVSP